MCVNLGTYAVLSVLALYCTSTLDLSPAAAGTVMLVATASLRLARVAIAPWIGRARPLVVLRFTLVAGAALYAVLALVHSAWVLVALLPAVGAAYGTDALLVKVVASRSGAAERRRVYFAALSTAVNVGGAAGPLAASLLVAPSSRQHAFWIASAGYALACAVTLLMEAPATGSAPGPSGLRGRVLATLGRPELRFPLVANALGYALYAQLFAFFPLLVAHGLRRPGLVGTFLAVNAVLVMIAEVPLAAAASRARLSAPAMIAAGFALFAVGYGVIALDLTVATAYVAIVVWAAAEMVLFPSCDVVISEHTSDADRLAGFTLAAVAAAVGEGIGAFTGVSVAGDAAGSGRFEQLATTLAVGIGITAGAAVIVRWLWRARLRSEPSTTGPWR